MRTARPLSRPLALLLVVAIMMMSAALTGCSKEGSSTKSSSADVKPGSSAPKKVRVAYYGGTCEVPIYVAKEKEVFAKQGLDAELVKVDFDTLKEGLATGKIDAVQVTAGELKAVEQGLGIKVTAGVHTGCIEAVAPKGSSIQDASGLKGKTIGVEALGGVPMTLLSIELGRKGIDPKTGVTWKAYPAPQLAQAMEKGEIDAFATWDPFGALAIKDKGAKRIFSNTYDSPYKDQYCCFIGVGSKVAAEDPDKASKITAALQEASTLIESDKAAAAEIATSKDYAAGDEALTEKLLTDYSFEQQPDQDMNLQKTEDSLRFWLTAMKDQGILEESTDANELLESVLLRP